jgi:hypothetical protein
MPTTDKVLWLVLLFFNFSLERAVIATAEKRKAEQARMQRSQGSSILDLNSVPRNCYLKCW